MPIRHRFCKIAIDTPLRRLFDYQSVITVQPGMRVRVPFGRQRLVGVVVSLADHTDVPAAKLRDVLEVLDATPVFQAAELALLIWAADYYHHPIGEVFAAALPRLLRAGHMRPSLAGDRRRANCGGAVCYAMARFQPPRR
jgi:primosomal protein N' (replication factor Y)